MTNLNSAQRAYQFDLRIIKDQDECCSKLLDEGIKMAGWFGFQNH
jgi:flagellar basal body rod protein FlgG